MQIVFLFYDGMTLLDAIGPHEIVCRIPNSIVKCVASSPGLIQTCSGLAINADYSLTDVLSADILIIPGGGKATSLSKNPEILDWVRRIHQTTTWTTSVCTGSLILGAAGLLTGLKATTHWTVLDRLLAYGAVPTHKRIVESGKIITAAGVSAGIDMSLMLTAKIANEDTAKRIQLAIEYDPEPPFNSGSPDKADPAMREALRSIMLSRFEKA